jgi:hypothetical protein
MLQALRERLLSRRGLPVLGLEVFLHLCADVSSLMIISLSLNYRSLLTLFLPVLGLEVFLHLCADVSSFTNIIVIIVVIILVTPTTTTWARTSA